MIIDKLNLERFGKFNNQRFKLQKGLNVIYGKNESGKTTLVDFVVFMLYGADKRTKTGLDKYEPRDGTKMCGSMEYTRDNEGYIVQRQNSSLADVSVKNLNRGEDVVLNTTPGADIFGFGAEAFKKTFYSGSVTSVISDDKEGSIADRLSRLSGSADGEATYAQLKKYLCSKINSYTSKRCDNPVIPTLEESLYPAQKNLEAAKQKSEQATEQKKLLPELYKQLEKLEASVKQEEKKRENLHKIQLNSEYTALSNQIEELESIINSNRYEVFSDLNERDFALMQDTGADIIENSYIASTKYETAHKITAVLTAVFFVMTAVFTGIFFARLANYVSIIIWAMLFVISGILSLAFKKLWIKNKNNYEKTTHKIAHLLGMCEISDAKDFVKLYNSWLSSGCPTRELAVKKLEELRNNFDILVNNIKTRYELSEIIHLDKSAISYDNIDRVYFDEDALKNVYSQIEQVKTQIRNIEAVSVEEYGNLYERAQRDVQNLKTQLDNANRELVVYKKALSMLEVANSDISRVFAPRVSAYASQVFYALTGGRYDTLNVNNKLSINVKDNMAFYDDTSFSTAAREQMYLALRLAAVELSAEEKLPVLLDDCFSFYDDERKQNSFEFLREFSKDRQVIYLTCHKSDVETAYANGANVIMLSD